jgi:hypothetical protein
MQASQVPADFPIPWANGAGGSYIRTPPTASQIGVQAGAASLTDGFPPLCFTPIASGGSWPYGQDFNGIFRWITQCIQWMQAGGPAVYNSAFSTQIGGYPAGAILRRADFAGFWINEVDNNTTDPDTGGANWQNAITVVGQGASVAVASPAVGDSTLKIATTAWAGALAPYVCAYVSGTTHRTKAGIADVITGITNPSTGVYVVSFTSLAGSNFVVDLTADSASDPCYAYVAARSVSSVTVHVVDTTTNALVNNPFSIAIWY